MNTEAEVLEASSVTQIDAPERIEGKRVLAIEDGPTITDGGMPDGAVASASRRKIKIDQPTVRVHDDFDIPDASLINVTRKE